MALTLTSGLSTGNGLWGGFSGFSASGGLWGSTSSIDPAATTWQSAVVAAGGTVSGARLQLVSNLITSLKTHGTWTLLDRLWLLCGENTTSALIDIVATQTAVAHATLVFNANLGYASDGSTGYIDTVTLANAYTHFSQNNAIFGAYMTTSRTVNQAYAPMGNGAVNGGSGLVPLYGDGNVYNFINSTTFSGQAPPWSNAQGMYLIAGPDSTHQNTYRNNNTIALTNVAGVSAPTSATSFMLCAVNTGGGAGQQFSQDNMAASYIGGLMTSTQIGTFMTDVNTFMTALGINVF